MIKTLILSIGLLINTVALSQPVEVDSCEVKETFGASNVYVVLVILMLVVFTLTVLEKTKKFNRSKIILSKDVGISKTVAASILLFGAFVNALAHIFASRVDETIPNDDFSALLTGGILLLLFFIVKYTTIGSNLSKTFLKLGFTLVLLQNLVQSYFGNIHPFYLAAIIIVMSVTPVIFDKLKNVLRFVIGLLLVTTIVVLTVENPVYNRYLFLIGVAIISLVVTLLTYIRNNSLEKLIFTSGVLNKGNVLVVAFDKKTAITYVSENVKDVIPVSEDEIMGKPIAILNQFQPKLKNYNFFESVELVKDFMDGKVFVSPFLSIRGEIVYYQWSCKHFSDDVRVVLGQDITEKINLETYYELIVSSADDLIFQTDPSGYFTFVNDKCVRFFGKKEEELVGKHWSTLVHPDYVNQANEFYSKQFKEKAQNTFYEFPIVDAKGELKWLGQNLTTLLKPGSETWVKGYLGLARDITERRKALSVIKEQNKDIRDSINYAKRIQYNMLPRNEVFERNVQDYFILFKPKDIVSGDFYWVDKFDDDLIMACVDCTGHGVPGAFMTLLGINNLNEIIKQRRIFDPGAILNELDERILKELQIEADKEDSFNDGMVVSIIKFNTKTKELTFATAGGRLAVLSEVKKSVETYRLGTKHIGDVEEGFTAYKTGKISYDEGEAVYLFSDGYPDQFGGERNKKITYGQFLQLLIDSAELTMHEQQLVLNQFFNDWKGSHDQTDDVTVIGLKF